LKHTKRWGSVIYTVSLGLLIGCSRTQAPVVANQQILKEAIQAPLVALNVEEITQIPGTPRIAFSQDAKVYATHSKKEGRVEIFNLDSLGQRKRFIDLSEWMSPSNGKTPVVSDIKVDGQKRLILAEKGTGKLLRISPNARKLEVLADSYDGYQFASIEEVEIGLFGEYYLSSSESGVIYRVDPELGRVGILNEKKVNPGAICIRPKYNQLIVAEPDFYRIIVFDLAEGVSPVRYRTLIDFYPENVEPEDVAFDEQGYLYVSLGARRQIWVFDLINAREVTKITTTDFAGSLFRYEKDLFLGGGAKMKKIKLPL
jgi:sugar lactone lactonase YvrE